MISSRRTSIQSNTSLNSSAESEIADAASDKASAALHVGSLGPLYPVPSHWVFEDAFGQIVIPTGTIDNVTTKTMITYAQNNYGKSAEVVLYRDNIQSYTDAQKAEALQEFKDNLQVFYETWIL